MFQGFKRIASYINSTLTFNQVMEEVMKMKIYDPKKNYCILTTTGRGEDETNYFVGVEE